MSMWGQRGVFLLTNTASCLQAATSTVSSKSSLRLRPLPSLLAAHFQSRGFAEGGGLKARAASGKAVTPRNVLDGGKKAPSYEPPDRPVIADIVRRRGVDLLNDPISNRGTGFSWAERERLGLRGLLPPTYRTLDNQVEKTYEIFFKGFQHVAPPADTTVSDDDIRKWVDLAWLQDRNLTLFYRLLVERFTEMAPIVYTPTVGWACLNYSRLYTRPRGMFFTSEDQGLMSSMVFNWKTLDVDAIVVTDGSRVLGLGDLGIQGLPISVGKLDLYVAAAGFHPEKVLPIVIDVGTDNEELLADPSYMGLRQKRVRGDRYFAIMDEFVRAVTGRWPQAVLQFEDFQTDAAFALLERYRDSHLVFNDDIQGTAAMAVAGICGGLRVRGQQADDIRSLKIVCAGAGSAGMGVLGMIERAMILAGLKSVDEARQQIFVLDVNGLVTRARPSLPDHVIPFAHPDASLEGLSLLETVEKVKPDVLIGLSAAGKIFTKEVLEAVGRGCEQPMIFPMSNPTSRMECSAEEAQLATNGRVIFASGSPQNDVTLPDGTLRRSSQANNMYIFPGLALGAHIGKCRTVSDEMLMAAARSVPELLTEEDLKGGAVYPPLCDVRSISLHVALAVVKQALQEGHMESEELQKRLEISDQRSTRYIWRNMYEPKYGNVVELPAGILE